MKNNFDDQIFNRITELVSLLSQVVDQEDRQTVFHRELFDLCYVSIVIGITEVFIASSDQLQGIYYE